MFYGGLQVNEQKRAAKRHSRENRPGKKGTWKCRCGLHHRIGQHCPIPKETGDRTLDIALMMLKP